MLRSSFSCSHGANGGQRRSAAGRLGSRATWELIFVLRSSCSCSGAHFSCSGAHFRAQELIFVLRSSFSCSGAHFRARELIFRAQEAPRRLRRLPWSQRRTRRLPGSSFSCSGAHFRAPELIFLLRSSFFVLRSSFSCSGSHFRAQELMFMLRSSFCTGSRRRRLAVVSRLPDCESSRSPWDYLSTLRGPGKIKVMWVGCQLSLLGGRKPIATTQCDRRHAIKDCSAYAAKPETLWRQSASISCFSPYRLATILRLRQTRGAGAWDFWPRPERLLPTDY